MKQQTVVLAAAAAGFILLLMIIYAYRSLKMRGRRLERERTRDPLLDLEIALTQAYKREDYSECAVLIADIEAFDKENFLAKKLKTEVIEKLK